MHKFLFLFLLISLSLSATVVHYSELPEDVQKRVVPDLDGNVLLSDQDSQLIEQISLNRDLPTVAAGWPVSYTNSNCKNGAIYLNMDADPEMEILFGVGTKVTALNLDGTVVPGWPKQLNFYIWSSPAAGDIDGDGMDEIVCTSRNNTTANSGELYAFELDGTPCAGFPVIQAGGGTNNVCLFDLNDDGDLEILVNVRNHPQGWVYVFDGDGSVYPGFPQELDYIPGAGISAGDITGDGIPEIVALSYNMLHVYDISGNILPGFPLENTGYTYSYSQPIIFDLDSDEQNEIIWGGCSSAAGAVFAVNSDATSVTGWPQMVGQWIFGTVSLGDIDQDGSIDVVVGDQVASGTPMDYIYAWDAEGNSLAGFPTGPTNAIYAQVGIADLDGDGNVELMIDDNNFGFGYDCYNHDGTHSVDWPLPCGTVWSSTTMQITPVFGDVDNDGEIEIIGAATDIMGWVVECYLWETGEVWNEELAYMIIDGVNVQHNGLYETDEPATFDPPELLTGYAINYNEVLLTWQPPGGSDILKHHNGYDNNGIGAGLNMTCAARFTEDELSQYYNNYELSEIAVYFRDYYTSAIIKVWEGGSYGNPGTEIYSNEIINSLVVNSWNFHELTTPISLITDNEYWIGFHVLANGGYPASVDAGPMVPDKGAWILYGNNWETLTNIGGSMLSYNWCITGMLSPTGPSDKSEHIILGNIDNKFSRSLAGYKVYREGEEIAEIDDPEVLFYHDDIGLNAGVYEYHVTALYTDPIGESEPSNSTNVEITLPAPENLEAYLQLQDIYLEWDEPQMVTRNRDYYTIYIDDEFFAQHSHELYVIVPGILSPGEHYCYVTATYDGGFESGPSNVVDLPVLGNDGNIITLNTELRSNHPNPFNPTTTINYSLKENSIVDLIIYNIKGQKVKQLVSEQLSAGQHSVIWDGKDRLGKSVSSGIYFYEMNCGDYTSVKKMILMK